MKVYGQEYMQIGSYVLLQKPYIEGKIIGKIHHFLSNQQPMIKVTYAEDKNGMPLTELFNTWATAPIIEMELFTGDIEEVEAKLAAHLL